MLKRHQGATSIRGHAANKSRVARAITKFARKMSGVGRADGNGREGRMFQGHNDEKRNNMAYKRAPMERLGEHRANTILRTFVGHTLTQFYELGTACGRQDAASMDQRNMASLLTSESQAKSESPDEYPQPHPRKWGIQIPQPKEKLVKPKSTKSRSQEA
ncbi:hypothetical protein M413DRAFT_10321 [Hebeloma cylindrosporum]|uniref:Uncharacterized protein n=1 Tax=Hebeloma cylindrosporum TaxID=76867 RepID=A0A0C3C1W3_HEBCY|nr:hypothetical protein M413DRAFT_10321 [Hebeloma cylindrosporum h7]